MSNEIKVTVRGWVGSEPVRHVLSTGKSFARFRVASTARFRDGATGVFRDGQTEWFTAKAWKDLAENVLASLHKGTPVILHGTLSSETWQTEHGERSSNVIRVDAIGPDLNQGTATFVRTVRTAVDEESVGPAAEVPPTGGPADAVAGLTGPDGVRYSGEELADEDGGEVERAGSTDYELTPST